MADDLTRPLGMDTASRRARRFQLPVVRIAVGAVALLLGVALLWVLLVDDPAGGEPQAVAMIQDAVPVSPAAVGIAEEPPARQTGRVREAPPADPNAPPLAEMTAENGLQSFDGGIVIRAPGDEMPLGLPQAPNPALLEVSDYGPIPTTGPDGRRPVDAYARPAPPPGAATARIAIVVTGLGISQSGTSTALDQLPGAVTVAFAPYGTELGKWVGRARGSGHEVLLQLPLEPFDFPNNDPGPQTLMVNDETNENPDRMAWLLSRFTTYAGVVNYMGARFTSEPEALLPVLRELGERGLLYLDDGASPRSRAAELAPGVVPYAMANVVLDGIQEPDQIDDRLAQLETIARERGSAVGIATAFPVSIARIRAWAATAANRGFELVPVTAVMKDVTAETAHGQ